MRKRFSRRLFHAAVTGQFLTAVGVLAMLQADIGAESWSVLQQGLSRTCGFSFGTASVLVGVTVMAVALLLKAPVGLGSVLSVVMPGTIMDLLQRLELIPYQTTLAGGVVQLLIGLEILVIGTWVYMSQGMGEGPRDALMVALARRLKRSPGVCRTCLELGAIAVGWLLGGKVGWGTVIVTLTIGPLIDWNFRLFRFDATAVHQETLPETWRSLHRETERA